MLFSAPPTSGSTPPPVVPLLVPVAGLVVVLAGFVAVAALPPQPELVSAEAVFELPPIPATLPSAPRTDPGAPITVFRVPVAMAAGSGATLGLAMVPPTIMGMARLVRLADVA